MSLFQWGNFKLHSGEESWWRIDCDALSNSEIELFAKMIHDEVGVFHIAYCPKSHPGSAAIRLRNALAKYRSDFVGKGLTRLFVDDVLTTGDSMEECRLNNPPQLEGERIIGIVLFARGKCPDWITPIFQMNSED